MYAKATMPISIISLKVQAIVISAKNKDIKHITIGLGPLEHQNLKVIAPIARSMDIGLLSVDQSQCGHQIN